MNWMLRISISILLMTTALVFVLRKHVLPYPFLVLTVLYCTEWYFVLTKRVNYKYTTPLIVVLAVAVGAFVYTSNNAVWFWLTNALALVASAGVSLLAYSTRKQ